MELTIEGEGITERQTILVPSDSRDAFLRGFRTGDVKALKGKDISASTLDGTLYEVVVRVPEPMTGHMS
ncbi:MAG: hypothetical protein AABX00_02870 [Nanoarchaeota archaeon]